LTERIDSAPAIADCSDASRSAGILWPSVNGSADMKIKIWGLIALAPLLSFSPAKASTYEVDFTIPGSFASVSEAVVTGRIVTDCDTCVLHPSDFVSWSFTINGAYSPGHAGPVDFAASFSGGPSDISSFGTSPLSARGGLIRVNSAFGELEFFQAISRLEEDSVSIGPDGGLFAQAGCFKCSAFHTGSGGPIGVEVEVAATPLPATLPFFAAGLGVMGLLLRRRVRKGRAVIAAA
jgi:hypothetical protein